MLLLPDARVAGAVAASDAVGGRRRPNWTWGFGAACMMLYTVVGWWLLNVRHFAINDALARTLTAKIMILGRDPHLASMGYYWMPLPTLVRIPFVVVLQPFGQAVLAGPATAAFFAAATLPVLHATGRRAGAPPWLTTVVVVAYGLSPVTVFSAASGMSETTFGFFLALTLLGCVRWFQFQTSRDLAFVGWALAGAMLSRFESLVVVPVVAVAIALTSERGRRVPAVVLAVLPAGLMFGLFTLTSNMIKNDAMYWWHVAKEMTATPDGAPWLPADRSVGPLVIYGIGLVLALAPAAVVVLLGGLLDLKRARRSVGILGLVFVLPAAVGMQTIQGTSWAIPRFYILTPLLAAAAALWFAGRSAPDANSALLWSDAPGSGRRRVGTLAALCVPLGAITGTLYLASDRLAVGEGEFVLMQPLLGRADPDDPVDGTGPTPAPATLAWLDDFQNLSRDLDPLLAAGATVAMDSKNGYSMIFSDHPGQYLVPEDRDFQPIMSDPVGRVDYIIVLKGSVTFESTILTNALSHVGADGRWELMENYRDRLELYRWVATSAPG